MSNHQARNWLAAVAFNSCSCPSVGRERAIPKYNLMYKIAILFDEVWKTLDKIQ